ncbi:MAG: PAS domain S-box protein, partial [Deltaproteobacteria bacterium]|nr:PAS domain S-box protein [Deltaproteobacteria bacterium]
MKSKKLRQLIVWKFIRILFILSLILVILDIFIHLSFSYRDQIRSLQRESRRICQNALPGLASSLKGMDRGLVQAQLEEIVRIPNLEWAKIEDKNQVIAVCGTPPKYPGPVQTFPIYYYHKNKPWHLGTLSIQTGLTNVYKNLFKEFVLIFPISGIRIFIMAFFVLIIFQGMVSRPLETLVEYFSKFDLTQTDLSLNLTRRRKKNSYPDEIDQLVDAINTICQRTKSAFKELDNELKKRLETEEALRHSEERYRMIYENAGDAIYTYDSDLRLTGLNRKAVDLIGYPENELIGRDIFEL